ncbi:MAG: CRTAC1 family protein [Acidobacteriota bacterium]
MRPALAFSSLVLVVTASSPVTAQTFTDRWAGAGFATQENNRGVALGDQDGDGRPDLFVTSFELFIDSPFPLPDVRLGGPDRLYRNEGAALFREVGSDLGLDDTGQGQGAAWADFDNDGRLDLYVVRGVQEAAGEPHLLYRQDTDGFDSSPSDFVDEALAGSSACWADFDADGRLDVYVTNGLDSSDVLPDSRQRLFRSQPDGSFRDVATEVGIEDRRNAFGCAWADHDGDGDQDLYVVNHGFEDPVLGLSDPQPNALYRNMLREEGVARFVDVATEADVSADDGVPGSGAGFGCAWGDFDNDGRFDLFIANGFSGIVPFPTPNRLFHGEADGTFTDRSLTILDPDFDESSIGVTLGDWDNDGDLDAFVTNVTIPAVSDASHDLLVNGGWPLHVLVNREDEAGVGASDWGGACASADFDGDGYLDLYATAGAPGADLAFPTADHLYMNDGGSRRWLQLDLEGRVSNRSAVGAVVTVDAGLRGTQTRQVSAGSGYQSMDDLRVEFGLGDATSARVTIVWPSGCVQELDDLAADTVHAVAEPCDLVILRADGPTVLRGDGMPTYRAVETGPFEDPEPVLGDGRWWMYRLSQDDLILRLRRTATSVELSW